MKDIDQFLALLADKLSIGVDRLYPVLLKQAYIARVESILLLLFLTAAIPSVRWVWRWAERKDDVDGWDEAVYLCPIIATFVAGVFYLGAFLSVGSYLAAWFNPDGWIVMTILSSLK